MKRLKILKPAEKILQFKITPFQDKFLFSQKRFVCFCGGWGTGKTLMLLLKAWNFCKEYSRQLIWFIRKERVDLEDSTLKDFETYFSMTIPSNRNFKFLNGSIISFRHGEEVNHNNLKNVNLSAAYIEQAEEFKDDDVFQMLRGRLRRKEAPYTQICLTANTDGHNYIWKNWKNNPPSEDYQLIEATTFENIENLPSAFVKDLERMKLEAPNHYNRYVLNSWEETTKDDTLFDWELLRRATELNFGKYSARRVLAIDVARFGEAKTVFTILVDRENKHWEQIHQESHAKQDTSWTAGHALVLRKNFNCESIIVDDDGLGGGVTDQLRNTFFPPIPFHAEAKPRDEESYVDAKAEGYFKLKEMIENGFLKILDDPELIDELLTIRFEYRRGKLAIVSKDKMRAQGIKSPDRADSLMMAVACRDKIGSSLGIRDILPLRQVEVNAGFSFARS